MMMPTARWPVLSLAAALLCLAGCQPQNAAENPPPEETASVETSPAKTHASSVDASSGAFRASASREASHAAGGAAAEASARSRAERLPRELPPLPRSAGVSSEGWEAKGRWAVLAWGDPAEAALTREKGNAVLRIVGKGGKRGKVAVSTTVRMSLAEKGKVTLWTYNPSRRSVKVAFAVFVHDDRVYYESLPVEVGRGWRKAEWDLAASNYKCESSGWRHNAAIWSRGDVRELVLLVYEGKPFELAVDAVSLDLAPSPPKEAVPGSAAGGAATKREGKRKREPAEEKKPSSRKSPPSGEEREKGEETEEGIEVSAPRPVLDAELLRALQARLSEADRAKIRKTLRELSALDE